MSANPIDENTTPKTTGSLEELFRHHLGQEAAVPPRLMLWDQIDNSLLIRQNESYRRRLVATRWVAAASLLLATLAGTGWWAGRYAGLEATDVASSRPAPAGASASSADATGRTRNMGDLAGQASGPVAATTSRAPVAAATSLPGRAPLAVQATLAERSTSFNPAAHGTITENSVAYTRGTENAGSAPQAAGSRFGNRPVGAVGAAMGARGAQFAATGTAVGIDATAPFGAGAATGATVTVASATSVAGNAAGLETAVSRVATSTSASSANGLAAEGSLSGRLAALRVGNAAGLPNGLATVAVPIVEATPDAHRWQFGTSYTAGVFNPNINFSRAGIEGQYVYDTGPAFGPDSPSLTETAATQYRQNLRSGLSQRIALLATRHLAGHWSLSTGTEFTQATAKSATTKTLAFVGEQIPDVHQATTGPMSTTNFRYRLASIPVELRYTNPVKKGWSLYGRLGGVVSGLLGVRSEVDGDQEATKTYSILSEGTPYRRVVGSLRGGMGAQFRPRTGTYALTMGPVAELGLTSLNAHPAQSFSAQSRAYSVGVEAGVEFGR